MNESPKRYCSNCGHPTNPQDEFCGNCGYKLTISENVKQGKNKTEKIIKSGSIFLILISVVFIISMLFYYFIFSNSGLPQAVSDLYSKEVTITEFSKARYPENFVWGLGGWLRDADEIWCVTYSFSSWPNRGSDIAVKKGGDWGRYVIYESMWNMVGCGHDYK